MMEAAVASDYVYVSRLKKLHVFLPFFALFFWVWALINTLTKDYVDGGVLTFALVVVSSIYTLLRLRGGEGKFKTSTLLYFPSATHIILALNYVLGAFLMKHHWGKVYCAIFTFLWIGIAILHLYWTQKLPTQPEEFPQNNDIEGSTTDTPVTPQVT